VKSYPSIDAAGADESGVQRVGTVSGHQYLSHRQARNAIYCGEFQCHQQQEEDREHHANLTLQQTTRASQGESETEGMQE
jgi:hypothetical protein